MSNPITKIILTAVDRTKAAFTSAKDGMKSIGDSAGNLKSLLGSVFAGLSVAGFIGQIKSVADEMDSAVKSAAAAGTSVEKFSALSYASGQSGGGPDVLQKSLIKLSGSLEDSEDSASTAAATWRKLNLDPKQFNDSSDALLAIAERFKAMPDGIAKTNLAVDLFGEKIGPKMIPLLNEGREGIKLLTDEAQRLGKVLDDETGAAAVRFNDTLDRLNARKVSLFAKALPSLEQYVSALDEIIGKGTALDKIAFFTTGFISEEVLNRITDAGQRVGDYTAEIDKLQEQLQELKRVEGDDSPNVKIWEQRISALEQTRAKLAKKANDDRLKDSKETNDALGKGYEDDAKNFKRANEEKIKDAQRLQSALLSAFESSLDAEKRYREEAKKLRSDAAGGAAGDKSPESLKADGAIANMKLNRITGSGTADEIRAQVEVVRDLAAVIDDVAQKKSMLEQADKSGAVAADKSAEAAGQQAAALAAQMSANEARMTGLKTATDEVNKNPVAVQVEPNPELKGLISDLKEVNQLIGQINTAKIAPGGGGAGYASAMSEALRTEALKRGGRR
ncbi:MAG: hypothetical protein WC736_16280 [Gallionella sp.]|jgi:hypothetical protein